MRKHAIAKEVDVVHIKNKLYGCDCIKHKYNYKDIINKHHYHFTSCTKIFLEDDGKSNKSQQIENAVHIEDFAKMKSYLVDGTEEGNKPRQS